MKLATTNRRYIRQARVQCKQHQLPRYCEKVLLFYLETLNKLVIEIEQINGLFDRNK